MSVLLAKLESAGKHLECLYAEQRRLQEEINAQLAVWRECKREFEAYPRKVYESRIHVGTWPTDIVFLVTDHFDIAEKIYLSAIGEGKPSLVLMIRPTLRALLHVKHIGKSRDVAKHSLLLENWLWLLNYASMQRPPKWKRERIKVASDMKTMALNHFSPVRFTVGGLTMTWLGPDGLIKIDGGNDWQRKMRFLKGSHKKKSGGVLRSMRLWFTWRATESNTGLIVDYGTPKKDQVILYGGRDGRFVVCHKDHFR